MIIYCSLHRDNHKLTGRDAEDLIYSLTAEWADAATEPNDDRSYVGEASDELLYGFCPRDMVRVFRDGEMYAEHLESMRESRLAASGDTGDER